jgi:aminomethyltransferase
MQRTALYQQHLDHGARMMEFSGWEMPLQYPTGINQEHVAVRTDVGIFDVSHMGELRILGPDATRFLQFATLNDPAKLRPGRAQYNMIPNDSGGLVDDVYLYREEDDAYLMVCNAGNTATVSEHLKSLTESFDCHLIDETATWSLLALQGPGSALLLGRHVGAELTTLRKNRSTATEISGCPVKLGRTGYTGEDGFEIFCHPTDAGYIWDILVGAGATPCGLGARDTLRLEAGFALFGKELTATTNPLCTPYRWVVKDKPFFGREAIWGKPCSHQLIGLKLAQRGIARQGYRVFSGQNVVGEITSGTISPLTRESIALGWILTELAIEGAAVAIEIRGLKVPATVTPPPFFKQ